MTLKKIDLRVSDMRTTAASCLLDAEKDIEQGYALEAAGKLDKAHMLFARAAESYRIAGEKLIAHAKYITGEA